MKHLSVLIKPASSACNMRCSYCFYADVSARREVSCHGVMTKDVMEQIIGSIYEDLEDGDHLAVAFQGGEPTLAGLPYFEAFVDRTASYARKVDLVWSIQTNGLLIDEKWAAFLKRHDFLVGLSLDISPFFHDAVRKGPGGEGTYEQVQRARRLLEDYGVPVNILSVLTKQMALRPDEVMDEMIRQGFSYVQFIPCLGPLKGDPGEHALTSDLFTFFYERVFQRWLKEATEGNWIHIQFIDAVLELIAGRCQIVCGLTGSCRVQHVVESDGSVYPCDFYVLDEYRFGSLAEEPLSRLQEDPAALRFLKEKPGAPEICQSCIYAPLCGGGCRRLGGAMYLDHQKNFCGYYSFLERNYPTLRSIARQLIL